MERTKFDKSKVNVGKTIQEKKDNISKQIKIIRHEASEEVKNYMLESNYSLTDYASALEVDLSAIHDVKAGKREFSGTPKDLTTICRRFLLKSPQELLFGEKWDIELPKILSSFLLKYQLLDDLNKEEIDKLLDSLPKQAEIDPAELSYKRLRELCSSEGKLLQGEYTEPYTTTIKASYMLWVENKQFVGNYSSLMFFCAIMNMPVDYFICVDYSDNTLLYCNNGKMKTATKNEKLIVQKYLKLSTESQIQVAGEVFARAITK